MTTENAPINPNFSEPSAAGGSGVPRRKKQNLLVPGLIIAAVLGVAGAAVGSIYFFGRSDSINSSLSVFEAREGPLVVSVTEAGTIKAANQTIIKNEVEGRTQILYIVPEGKVVTKGELLVDLDTTEMVEEKLEREIRVQNAEAAMIQASENLEVVKNQAEADKSAAALDYEFAKQDLAKYKLGDYPQALDEANAKIQIADEEQKRTSDKLEGSQRLYDQKFISKTEFRADQLAASRAALELQLAQNALKLLVEYDKVRQEKELEANVEQTEMALERANRKAAADIVQANAELRATTAEHEQQAQRLERDIAQIAKGKIYAPTGGMVVYATSAEGGWRGNDEPLQAGREVREREDLIFLPTARDRIAEVKVHESALDKIRKGLPARVTIDAIPNREFWGTVTKVSPLPDATTAWLNPDLKVYTTEVRIEGDHEELRTGMSCRAEIIIETYDKTVYVPVQSVVRVSGVPTVFVVRPGQAPEQREVEIGMDNNKMVVILNGLEAGEQVMLAPPLGETGTVESLRLEDVPDGKRDQADEARETNPPVRGPGGAGTDEGGEGREGRGQGERGERGGGGGGGGGGGNAAMMQAYQQIQAKATDDEKAKLTEYRDNQDFAGMQTYLRDLAEKYEITLPEPGEQPAGQPAGRGGDSSDESEDRGERSTPAAADERATSSAEEVK